MTTHSLKDLLYRTAAAALHTLPDDTEAEVLALTIGVVHSLVTEERLADLALLLSVNFPTYYATRPPLLLYPPISTN